MVISLFGTGACVSASRKRPLWEYGAPEPQGLHRSPPRRSTRILPSFRRYQFPSKSTASDDFSTPQSRGVDTVTPYQGLALIEFAEVPSEWLDLRLGNEALTDVTRKSFKLNLSSLFPGISSAREEPIYPDRERRTLLSKSGFLGRVLAEPRSGQLTGS